MYYLLVAEKDSAVDSNDKLILDNSTYEVIKCQKCTGDVPVVFKSLLTLSEGIACPHCGSAAFMVP